MVGTDRRSPAGFLVRCSAQTSPSFVVEQGRQTATQISLRTLVSFVRKPRRTRAICWLNLLGEQGADVSRELMCNVLCVPLLFPCESRVVLTD